MALSWPSGVDTPKERLFLVERLYQRLIGIRNLVWKWHYEGITLEEYNTLPNQIRQVKSYTPNLTLKELTQFLDQWFFPRSKRALSIISTQRGLVRNEVNLADSIDMDTI